MSATVTLQLFPAECFRDIDGACTLKDAVLGATVANNQQIVAAVSGKVIRAVSGVLTSSGAATKVTFKSNSGGTQKRVFTVPANTVATPNVVLESDPYGHFDTDVGQGLYVDNTATDCSISIRYIEFKPVAT